VRDATSQAGPRTTGAVTADTVPAGAGASGGGSGVGVCAADAVTRGAGKPALAHRPLLSERQSGPLADLFKVMANPARLRLLHALHRAGELRVSDLAQAVGMQPQAVSNQLQRLSDKRIVASRRDGTSIRYRIADPCVPSLLNLGWCLVEETGR
jgi:DNA-binding transcriptional ArsR family regulator